MDAWLFAAGNGMRLRPLTDDFQKCLLPVRGKPMLEWWLDAAFDSEIFDRVHVNVHHMADHVEAWIRKYEAKKHRAIYIVNERSMLMGTAGTLYFHAEPGRDFMTAYTDTFSEDVLVNGGLMHLFEEWRAVREGVLAGIVPFKSPSDNSAGRIVTDGRRNVIGFKEKAPGGRGIVWSGIMFANAAVVDLIGRDDKNLATDVLPRLCHKMVTVGFIDAYDIGRGIEQYEQFKNGHSSQTDTKESSVPAA